MSLVRKVDKIGQVVDLDPGDRLSRLPVLEQFSDLCMCTNHRLMAVDAFVDTGHTGTDGAACVDMTVLAGNVILAGVGSVAEVDRLYGTVVGKKSPINSIASIETCHPNRCQQ